MKPVEQLIEFVYLKTLADYLADTAGVSLSGFASGMEYNFIGNMPHSNLQHYNVPCAVCYVSTRTSVLTIPAKTQCPLSWTREYYGYLTSAHNMQNHRSSFQRIASSPEAVPAAAVILVLLHKCITLMLAVVREWPVLPMRTLSCTVCTK